MSATSFYQLTIQIIWLFQQHIILSFLPQDSQTKIRIHGSRKRGTIVGPDLVASNGMIHLISKLMDSVAPTVESNTDVRDEIASVGFHEYMKKKVMIISRCIENWVIQSGNQEKQVFYSLIPWSHYLCPITINLHDLSCLTASLILHFITLICFFFFLFCSGEPNEDHLWLWQIWDIQVVTGGAVIRLPPFWMSHCKFSGNFWNSLSYF